MRIRALSVFESVIYHSFCIDASNPCKPTLEVDAVIRDGDVDEGPLLLTWADYVLMVGADQARRCRRELDRSGRLVRHLDVTHITFPLWAAGEITHR